MGWLGKGNSNMIVTMIEKVYTFLWGDLITIPLPGGSTLGISLLILLLIPTGIYFTIRTKLLPIRLFPDMVRALSEKKSDKNNLSLLLSKRPWHSSIKKRILFMVATGAVLPTISTVTGKKNRAENEKRFCFPFCLPFPAWSAGVGSVRLSAIPSRRLSKMLLIFRRCILPSCW